LKKMYLWKAEGEISVAGKKTTVEQAMNKQAERYVKAYTHKQAIWRFIHRLSRICGVEGGSIYMDKDSVFVVPDEKRDVIESDFGRKIKNERKKQKRKKELERMMKKTKENDLEKKREQLSFDF